MTFPCAGWVATVKVSGCGGVFVSTPARVIAVPVLNVPASVCGVAVGGVALVVPSPIADLDGYRAVRRAVRGVPLTISASPMVGAACRPAGSSL